MSWVVAIGLYVGSCAGLLALRLTKRRTGVVLFDSLGGRLAMLGVAVGLCGGVMWPIMARELGTAWYVAGCGAIGVTVWGVARIPVERFIR